MWVIRLRPGVLFTPTLAHSRSEAWSKLFDYMPDEFRRRYWKDLKRTYSAYRRLGYQAVRVRLVEREP